MNNKYFSTTVNDMKKYLLLSVWVGLGQDLTLIYRRAVIIISMGYCCVESKQV